MLRTALHATPWTNVSPLEICTLARTAGLHGVVVAAPHTAGADIDWCKASDSQQLRIEAVRVESGLPETILSTSDRAMTQNAQVIIARPCLTARPNEAERAAWRQIGDLVGARGHVLAVDFGATDTMDAKAMSQFIAELAVHQVRLCFDLGAYASLHPYSHWEVALQRVCTQLAVIWLSDSTGTPGDSQRPPLGEGTIDFYRTLEILRPLEFQGLVVLDVAPPRRAKGPPVEQLERSLTESVTHLRRCGWFDP